MKMAGFFKKPDILLPVELVSVEREEPEGLAAALWRAVLYDPREW